MDFEKLIQEAGRRIPESLGHSWHVNERVMAEDIIRGIFSPFINELQDNLHLSKGCADLAMKHRDDAEKRIEAVKAYLRSTSEEFLLVVESLEEPF